jgi:nucleotide-binding universal stress UspA family protein
VAPFHRALVGIGGSERHRDALALAQRLADPEGGELILAHVHGDRSLRLPRVHARADSAELLAAARGDLRGGITVTETSRSASSVARGLTELAEEVDADVVVVGSCSPAIEGRIAPGRIGMRLMQGAPCAVALAPVGWAGADGFRHVGIAFDGSPEAVAALTAGYSLAARDGAAVSLFYVLVQGRAGWSGVPPDEADRWVQTDRLRAQEQLDDAADAAPAGVNPRTVLLYGDPAQRITAACDGIVDVLFAGSRGYGPFHRALAGSVSEALVLTATEPFVVTPRSGTPPAPVAREDSAGAASA